MTQVALFCLLFVSVSSGSFWLSLFHNWPLGCWIINSVNGELNWKIERTELLNITSIHMLVLRQGHIICLYVIVSRATSGPTHLPSQWVTGSYFFEGKATGAWSWPPTFTPSYTFTERFLISLSKGQIYVINTTVTTAEGSILFTRNACSTCVSEWVSCLLNCRSYPLFLNTPGEPLASLSLAQPWVHDVKLSLCLTN
jgi:hypothetical protein